MSTSEIETSQGNETVIQNLSNFENVSSVRDEEIALDSGTQNEIEMQFWTQRISDKTNKEVANLRKEMDEKLEKILKEMKNNRRTQSVPNRRYREQNTPRAGTSKYTSNEDGEENASEPENQECEIQDNPFRPSNLNELSTPMQPLSIQNIDLNDSVVINEDRTGEDYHKYIREKYLFGGGFIQCFSIFPFFQIFPFSGLFLMHRAAERVEWSFPFKLLKEHEF